MERPSRRQIIQKAALIAAGTLTTTTQHAAAFGTGVLIPPAEDLMQEHGVLERLLQIYETLSPRYALGKCNDHDCLRDTTRLIDVYIQGHHERVEELLIFPVLTKANSQPELVSTLVTQHQVGKEITDSITRLLSLASNKNKSEVHQDLAKLTTAFSRMFRPHLARENTVVFPALRKIMTNSEYQEFTNKVHDVEAKMIPAELNTALQAIGAIEQRLGINDLNTFTWTGHLTNNAQS